MRLARKLLLLAVMACAAIAIAAPTAFAQNPHHQPPASQAEPLAVPAESATGLVVRAEPAGTLCPAVLPATPPATGNFTTSGGCVVHGGGTNIILEGHLFGIESVVSTCDVEFDLRTDHAARGYLSHQELTGGAACTRRPCHYPNTPNPPFEPPATRNGLHNEARPWRAYAREVDNPPVVAAGEPQDGPGEYITVLFCVEDRHVASLEPTGNKRHCGITIPFTEPMDHRYHFDAQPEREGTGSPRCEIEGEFNTESIQPTSGENQVRTQVEVNHTP